VCDARGSGADVAGGHALLRWRQPSTVNGLRKWTGSKAVLRSDCRRPLVSARFDAGQFCLSLHEFMQIVPSKLRVDAFREVAPVKGNLPAKDLRAFVHLVAVADDMPVRL